MPRIGSERIDAYPELCVAVEKESTCILFGSSHKVGALMFYAVENVFLLLLFFFCSTFVCWVHVSARANERLSKCPCRHTQCIVCLCRVNVREGGLLFGCTIQSLALNSIQDAHMRQILKLLLYTYSPICINKAYPFMLRWVLWIVNINNLSFTLFTCSLLLLQLFSISFSIWNITFDSWASFFFSLSQMHYYYFEILKKIYEQ